jgi:hypothetical protein
VISSSAGLYLKLPSQTYPEFFLKKSCVLVPFAVDSDASKAVECTVDGVVGSTVDMTLYGRDGGAAGYHHRYGFMSE